MRIKSQSICKILIVIISISVFITSSIHLNIKGNENQNLVNKLESSDFNDNLYDNIAFSESNIQFPDEILISTSITYTWCSIPITYPRSNDSWIFTLPTNYNDASNYFIARSPYEVYHPLEEEELLHSYTGYTTHWHFPNEPISDSLNFTIRNPIAIFEKDNVKTNTSHTEFTIEVSRFEIKRPYHNVIFEYEIPQIFDLYSVEIWNQTGQVFGQGGINENITDTIDYTFGSRETTYGTYMTIEMNIGDLINGTDYLYRIKLNKQAVPPSFLDQWLANIFLPAIVGFVIGLAGTYSYLSLRKDKYGNVTNKTIFKWGIPIGIGGAVISIIIMYIRFVA